MKAWIMLLVAVLEVQEIKKMKNGKKPNKRQCRIISAKRLDYKNWLVVKDTPEVLEIVHRYTGMKRVICKGQV